MNSIKLKDVSYEYDNKNLFNKVNVDINEGELIAITGASGAGKSTLVDIILGLKEPSNGRVIINNKQTNKRLIRENLVGYVPQQPVLNSGSIRDNICSFKNSTIDHNAIERVIEVCELKQLIESLPDGIHSKISERGSNLSGGQAQRLAIARALYNSNHSILVLDEATSALDDDTSIKIMLSIKKLRKKIVIVVTHNTKVASICDKSYSL